MKLTVDEQGRLPGVELFRPYTTFEATLEPDGSIRLVELSPTPVVRPRMINGRLRGADLHLTRQTVAAAVRSERDA